MKHDFYAAYRRRKELEESLKRLLNASEAVLAAKVYNDEQWVGKLYSAKEQLVSAITSAKEKLNVRC